MAQTRQYSDFLRCLYDEQEPVGRIGRGCHYSVFRTAEWFDILGRRSARALVHDFAVIWDEDHDERIIEAIERMYVEGLLFPVQYIGERKGGLTAILAAKFRWGISEADFEAYKAKVWDIAENLSMDSWHCDFGTFDKSLVDGIPHQTEYEGLIADGTQKVDNYIRNIDNLWSICLRPYVAPRGETWESPTPPKAIFSK